MIGRNTVFYLLSPPIGWTHQVPIHSYTAQLAAAASDCCQTERSTALLDVESDEMLQQEKVTTENPPVTVTTRDLM